MRKLGVLAVLIGILAVLVGILAILVGLLGVLCIGMVYFYYMRSSTQNLG